MLMAKKKESFLADRSQRLQNSYYSTAALSPSAARKGALDPPKRIREGSGRGLGGALRNRKSVIKETKNPLESCSQERHSLISRKKPFYGQEESKKNKKKKKKANKFLSEKTDSPLDGGKRKIN